ncbi:MAG: Rne/Rng family ribonuclease [Aeriscardovia sp.]|nr:Rne/Rng family ribonuclease [Aeriscardovia sp.]
MRLLKQDFLQPTPQRQKKRGIVSRVGEVRVFVSQDFSPNPGEMALSQKSSACPMKEAKKNGSTACLPSPSKRDKKLLIRSDEDGVQASVIENGVLVEHFVSGVTDTMVGNIYLGRILKIVPGLDAAFVDIGEEKDGILHLPSFKGRKGKNRLNYGDPVLVQVTKDPRGHKGPLLTDEISLSGKFMVLKPNSDMVGASAKLGGSERTRLKGILNEILPRGEGGIARTAAENSSKDALEKDYAKLEAQLREIERRYGKLSRRSLPALLKSDTNLALKVTRDVFNGSFSRLEVQGEEFEKVRSYVKERNPELAGRVQKWDPALKKKDIFAAYRVEPQLDQGLGRVVDLPGGGTLVIDKTEAMTTIDVNSAKFTARKGDLEETATECNVEAAKEIGRQLRLRDIGGIVIVDFVNMRFKSDKERVLFALKKALEGDRSKHAIEGITSLGLVQISRQKLGHGLVESFSHECEKCHGRGLIISREPVKAGGPEE